MLNDRFWTKVDKSHPSGCWLWLANRNNKGYGMFRPGGTAPKALAHRLSYEHHHGAIPRGLYILHACDNPACVNPKHLRAGTHRQNMSDMVLRKRHNAVSFPGEQNPNATTTAKTVIGVRKDYVDGTPIKEILAKHRVSEAAFTDYVCGKSWRHLFAQPDCPPIEALKAEAKRRRRNNARLSQADADAIRERLAKGARGVDLAAEFGVHAATISDIKLRRIWP